MVFPSEEIILIKNTNIVILWLFDDSFFTTLVLPKQAKYEKETYIPTASTRDSFTISILRTPDYGRPPNCNKRKHCG